MRIISVLSLLLIVACASKSRESYPSHWWKEVPKSQAASWEILPQEANSGEVILSKRNELGILSNFAATPFVFEGKEYASVEGFWQMMKYPEGPDDARAKLGIQWPHTRNQVAGMVGFEAKRAGDKAKELLAQHEIEWVTYKGKKLFYRGKDQDEFYMIIRKAMEAKVEQNPVVKQVLIGTGDLKLLPDHRVKADAPKAWHYHDIYMEIRSRL